MSFSQIGNSNLLLLKKRFPLLAEQIATLPEAPFSYNETIETMIAKNGELTLTVGNKRVYSSYAPSKEANSLLAQIPTTSELFLFFSFGLGYLPLAIAKRFALNPKTERAFPIIIVEPDLSLLCFAFNQIDFTSLFSYPQLCFITSKEPFSLLETLAHYNSPYIYLFKTPLLTPLRCEFFQNCQTMLHQYQDHWEVNLNTFKSFSTIWTRNLFKGIKRIQENKIPHYPVKNLFGQFHHEECLILSAGPSLDRYKGEIKAFQKRGTIIAVDTTLTFCRENGIEPDFIVVSDCQYWNIRHLDFAPLKKSRIITELTVDAHLFQLKPIAFYLYQSRIPLYKAVSRFLPEWGELATGGSVVTTAFDFAIQAGFDSIFFAGLDLSYPENKTHYKGSRFENRALQDTNRINSIEKGNFTLLQQETTLNVADSLNDVIKSDRRMLLYRDWFVRHIKANQGNYYRLGDSGIEIEGIGSIQNLPPIASPSPKRFLEKGLKEDSVPPLPSFLPQFFNWIEEEKKFLQDKGFHLTGLEQSSHPFSAFLWISGWDFFHQPSSCEEEKREWIEKCTNDFIEKIKA